MASILDIIGNPFTKASGSVPQVPQGNTSYFPPAPVKSSPMAPASRMPSARPYSPLTDPEGPLARAGWIGALMATGPSRTEHLAGLEQQQMQQLGQKRAAIYQKLTEFVQSGLTPQKAFLSLMNTPEGVDFVINDPDPNEAIQQFLKMSTTDPTIANRQAAFGGAGAGGQEQPAQGGTDIFTGQPQTPDQGQQTDIFGQPQQPQAAQQPSLLSQAGSAGLMVPAKRYVEIAEQLIAAGDKEGADTALKMAEEARQIEAAGSTPTTDELKEYDRYRSQELEAGRQPMSWLDYKTQLTKSGSSQVNVNTAEGLATAKTKAIIDVDTADTKAIGEVASAAGRVVPILDEVERIAKSAPGGMAGQLTPYLARIGSALGMEVPKEWSDAEALQGLTMQLVPLVRQPGGVSNYEQQTYQRAVPSLVQSKEGRMAIASILRKQAIRTQEIFDVARNTIGDPDRAKKLAEIYNKPLLTPEELKTSEEAVARAQEQAKFPNAPKIGTIEGGYEYVGGDPANKDNWKKAK